MLLPFLHLVLHAAVPAAVALAWDRPRWLRVWAILMAGMLIDLDHLLANPVFDPDRCSIGFHPLHTWPAIGAYALLALLPRARLIGLGLVIHIVLDALDCLLM